MSLEYQSPLYVLNDAACAALRARWPLLQVHPHLIPMAGQDGKALLHHRQLLEVQLDALLVAVLRTNNC